APSAGMLAAALGPGPEATVAAVPAALVETTVRSALVTATSTTAGLVPASVAALTRKGLKGMFLSNLKALVIVLVATGGSTTGLLALAQRGPAQPQPATPAAGSPGSAQPQPGDSTPAEKFEQGRLTKNPKWRTLAAARIEAARKILGAEM